MKRHTLPAPLILCLATSLFGGEVKHVNAQEAAALLEKGGVVVLDVRTDQEYAEGHLKGSKQIDVQDPSFNDRASKLDPSATYLVHCRSGRRSADAVEKLQKLGIKNLIHLDGGINAWNEAGLPVEK